MHCYLGLVQKGQSALADKARQQLLGPVMQYVLPNSMSQNQTVMECKEVHFHKYWF